MDYLNHPLANPGGQLETLAMVNETIVSHISIVKCPLTGFIYLRSFAKDMFNDYLPMGLTLTPIDKVTAALFNTGIDYE